VLNEIGRALSSTLNKEDLLRKVWEELRRLFVVDGSHAPQCRISVTSKSRRSSSIPYGEDLPC